MDKPRSPLPLRLAGLALRALWGALVIAVPALGVWVGSSLAAYLNGPVWLVCVAGLLLFPVLPLAWDAWAQRRKRRRAGYRPVLSGWDRLVLRTLAINLVFLGGLLVATPQTGFTALSTRGDWMLEGAHSSAAQAARRGLFATADRLQWLYEWSSNNAFEDLIEDTVDPTGDDAVAVEPPPPSDWADPWKRAAEELERTLADELPDEAEPVDAPQPLRDQLWPRPAELEPVVVKMPASAKQSIRTVGRYIADNTSDPYQRVKAIHDFVANHVAYDIEALNAGRYPNQSAKAVFDTGRGVCAGYANLVKALGKVTGDEIVVVVGDTRERGGDIAGDGHAWNAARIDGRWLLMDATWNAGHISDGTTFEREYTTDFLFAPPEIMGATHFPDDSKWQLRETPITRGEFVRQPMMQPRFFAQGFSLPEGTRSQVTVADDYRLQLGNARGYHVMAHAVRDDGHQVKCTVDRARKTSITCPLAQRGEYNVMLFSSPVKYGSYGFVGELHVNARG